MYCTVVWSNKYVPSFLQKCHLARAIVDTWNADQRALLASISGQDLIVGGDGRCDSTGFSAMYGSYTKTDIMISDTWHLIGCAAGCSKCSVLRARLTTSIQRRKQHFEIHRSQVKKLQDIVVFLKSQTMSVLNQKG